MIGALRMLRLVRLLTFIKGVQQLRVIVSGLITGMKSVLYIVVLLFLVIYIFSIMVRSKQWREVNSGNEFAPSLDGHPSVFFIFSRP